MSEIPASLDARGLTFGIAVARFNARVTDSLLAGALDTLARHGAADGDVLVTRVAGAFELPQALVLLQERTPDALVALGALVRGETPHFDHLASAVTTALVDLAVASGIPVANGLLTCDTTEQALERSGGKAGNKGSEAAEAAIEMARLRRRLGGH